MILAVGEILHDVFPEKKVIGGAPFNFSFHLKNLGMPVAFVSRIGKDKEGEEIKEFLQDNNFDLEFIQVDNKYLTGRVIIKQDKNGEPQFNIIKKMAYDYIVFDNKIERLLNKDIELIYFGSLIQRSKNGFNTIREILENKNTVTKCFYDVNLRPDCYTKKVIFESLEYTDVLKLNIDELNHIRSMFGISKNNKYFIEYLMDQYSFDMVAVTMGKEGSSLYYDNRSITLRPEISRQLVVDPVGAGDAFAALIAIGYLKKIAPDEIISLASDFASIICGIRGALPEDRKLYENFRVLLDMKGESN